MSFWGAEWAIAAGVAVLSIPLVYASSAATYGLGEHGYDDRHDIIDQLSPLNPYGHSKNDVDKWILSQTETPPFWAGLKFFNVYGPNEYHKGRMASVIFHAFNQIKEKGSMKLFRSHNPNFEDGCQLRDFVYVKDVVDVCLFLMEDQPTSGIYNLGSGKARTFLDLAKNTFSSLGKPEANMSKLIESGYTQKFHTLEEGIKDYVENYLISGKYF